MPKDSEMLEESKPTSVLRRALTNIRKDPRAKNYITIQKEKIKRLIKETPSGDPGVVYLTHIPPGFCEDGMKEFFEQFGNVNRLRLARSEKTGRCKGYAHIEFEHAVVAKIVAETMNNFLLDKRLLKAQLVDLDQFEYMKKGMFWKKNTFTAKEYPKLTRQKLSIENINTCSEGTAVTRLKKHLKSLDRVLENLHKKGIKYKYKPDVYKWKPVVAGKYVLRPKTKNIKRLQKKEKNVSVEIYKPVLEIDESDDEIEFKTPPNFIKRKLVLDKSDAKRQKMSGLEPNEHETEHESDVEDDLEKTQDKHQAKVSAILKKSGKKPVRSTKKKSTVIKKISIIRTSKQKQQKKNEVESKEPKREANVEKVKLEGKGDKNKADKKSVSKRVDKVKSRRSKPDKKKIRIRKRKTTVKTV